MKILKKDCKPKYKHDTDCCEFVKHDVDDLDFGSKNELYENEDGYIGMPADIYVCCNCVIMRYSDRVNDNRGIGMEDILNGAIERKRITEDKEIMDAYYAFQGKYKKGDKK